MISAMFRLYSAYHIYDIYYPLNIDYSLLNDNEDFLLFLQSGLFIGCFSNKFIFLSQQIYLIFDLIQQYIVYSIRILNNYQKLQKLIINTNRAEQIVKGMGIAPLQSEDSKKINKNELALRKKSQIGKHYTNKSTKQQYLLTQIYSDMNTNSCIVVQNMRKYFIKRSQIRNIHIPQMIQINNNIKSICSTVPNISIWMKHPLRPLQEEIEDRQYFKQVFNQGQIWMIVYSALNALLQYQILGISVKLSLQSLFISNSGDIILSDAWIYTSNWFFNAKSQQFRISPQKNIEYLLQIVEILMKCPVNIGTEQSQENRKSYSAYLYQLLDKLKQIDNGVIRSYKMACSEVVYFKNKLQMQEIKNREDEMRIMMNRRKTLKNSNKKLKLGPKIKINKQNKVQQHRKKQLQPFKKNTIQEKNQLNQPPQIKGLGGKKKSTPEQSQSQEVDSILVNIENKYNFPFEQIYKQIQGKLNINTCQYLNTHGVVPIDARIRDVHNNFSSIQKVSVGTNTYSNQIKCFRLQQVKVNKPQFVQQVKKQSKFSFQNVQNGARISQRSSQTHNIYIQQSEQNHQFNKQYYEQQQQLSDYSSIKTDPQVEQASKDCTINAVNILLDDQEDPEISRYTSALWHKNKQFLQSLITKEKNAIQEVSESDIERSSINCSVLASPSHLNKNYENVYKNGDTHSQQHHRSYRTVVESQTSYNSVVQEGKIQLL